MVVGGKFGGKYWIYYEGALCLDKKFGSDEWFVAVKFMFMTHLWKQVRKNIKRMSYEYEVYTAIQTGNNERPDL